MQRVETVTEDTDTIKLVQDCAKVGLRLVEVQKHIDGERMIFSNDPPVKGLKEQYAEAKADSERIAIIAQQLGLI
jgi:hypothetical protein